MIIDVLAEVYDERADEISPTLLADILDRQQTQTLLFRPAVYQLPRSFDLSAQTTVILETGAALNQVAGATVLNGPLIANTDSHIFQTNERTNILLSATSKLDRISVAWWGGRTGISDTTKVLRKMGPTLESLPNAVVLFPSGEYDLHGRTNLPPSHVYVMTGAVLQAVNSTAGLVCRSVSPDKSRATRTMFVGGRLRGAAAEQQVPLLSLEASSGQHPTSIRSTTFERTRGVGVSVTSNVALTISGAQARAVQGHSLHAKGTQISVQVREWSQDSLPEAQSFLLSGPGNSTSQNVATVVGCSGIGRVSLENGKGSITVLDDVDAGSLTVHVESASVHAARASFAQGDGAQISGVGTIALDRIRFGARGGISQSPPLIPSEPPTVPTTQTTAQIVAGLVPGKLDLAAQPQFRIPTKPITAVTNGFSTRVSPAAQIYPGDSTRVISFCDCAFAGHGAGVWSARTTGSQPVALFQCGFEPNLKLATYLRSGRWYVHRPSIVDGVAYQLWPGSLQLIIHGGLHSSPRFIATREPLNSATKVSMRGVCRLSNNDDLEGQIDAMTVVGGRYRGGGQIPTPRPSGLAGDLWSPGIWLCFETDSSPTRWVAIPHGAVFACDPQAGPLLVPGPA